MLSILYQTLIQIMRGLGYSVGIVELHGGRIEVKSGDGWTTFNIILPHEPGAEVKSEFQKHRSLDETAHSVSWVDCRGCTRKNISGVEIRDISLDGKILRFRIEPKNKLASAQTKRCN